MLSEKESFRRFLLVYILSTHLLLSIGTYLYYKMSYNAIIDNTLTQMKNDINTFIKINQKNHFLRNNVEPDYLGLPIAVYADKRYKTGNFTPKNIDFSTEVFQEESKLFYIHKEHKRWGEVYLITYKNIEQEIQILIQNVIIFFLLSTIFIVFISYILGKIFLKPMRETIELLESFIADATHEMNTPIRNILMNIELSKELYPKFANTQECKKVENSAFRISKIFKDLSYVKLNHKEIKHLEHISVDRVVKARIDFFQSFLKNKNLSLHTEIEVLSINIDKEDLIRLIDNLLSNAIKYAPASTEIEIKLTNCLEIVNIGTINKESKVIKKFFRENSNEGGFGLGLYIVDKISKYYNFGFTLETLASKVHAKVCFS